nr:DMT family transporter [Kordiimonas laminariae]
MRIILLTALAMIFFAANSVLNRLALAEELINPETFLLIRIGSGALFLLLLLKMKGLFKGLTTFKFNAMSVGGLALYGVGFTFAYLVLEAGFGALLLFGTVQITMFVGAIMKGSSPRVLQWLGAVIGMAGLVYVINPDTGGLNLFGAGLMVLAGIGWGLYSLAGQKAENALIATTASFVWTVPVALIVWLSSNAGAIAMEGAVLAAISGIITSGLGYVVWYRVLPELDTSVAAIVQLTVPLIAMLGGIAFIGEVWTLDFTIAAVLVLGGIALSLLGGKRQQS